MKRDAPETGRALLQDLLEKAAQITATSFNFPRLKNALPGGGSGVARLSAVRDFLESKLKEPQELVV